MRVTLEFEQALVAALAEGPEAAASLRRAHSLLEAAANADAPRLERARQQHRRALLASLTACCSVAPFLAARLRREPTWLFELAEDPDLARPRERAALEAALDTALAGSANLAATLRRVKYRELARVSVRECNPEWVPEERVGEVLAELSQLAEALLARALAHEQAALAQELGPPVWQGGDASRVPLRFAVLGLGKLGGGELNYSSDVDLIHVHESPPAVAGALQEGPGGLSPREYFGGLATRFGRLVEAVTREGFLYRVDLGLRPEGAQGAVVTSSDALADYYDGWAATWERAAFMKARPVAGDLHFGWGVVRSIHPMIYRSSMDLTGVASIREMKAQVEAEHARDARFHVKLGAGGIRDVEFVAQALQLLHGGRIPQVRGRSAQAALLALAEVGVLPEATCQELLRAYRFLRRLENRLQMQAERQTHWLPVAAAARERIARGLFPGPDAVAQLDARLAAHTERVRGAFDALLAEEGSARVIALFMQGAPQLMAVPEVRGMMEGLAGRFASEIASSADPERALNNLDRFVQGLGSRSFYYGLLADRPELVGRLVGLFALSRTLSSVVATLPQLIEPIFDDPSQLAPSREELAQIFDAIHAELAGRKDLAAEELGLAALRLFQQRELVDVGLLDLAEKIALPQVERALTEIAEVCVERALELAQQQLARTHAAAAQTVDRAEFLVVGLGTLGSRELGYGSDLDVLFLYDVPGADEAARTAAQEPHVRLAQKLAWALQTRTAEGVCYTVDARLRPSGNQGMLVTSLGSFARYQRSSAWLWERQALLRARPVAGNAALAERFQTLRLALLTSPVPQDLEAQIHHLRARMEEELAQERAGRRNLKLGRGGLLDVESVVQVLQLRHGAAHPELLAPARVEVLLERIGALGLLAAESVATLQAGWAFLQRLASRLRIVENRSISDLREERTDLDSVARAMGYPTSELTGTARLPLLDDYSLHTEAIRAVYRAALE